MKIMLVRDRNVLNTNWLVYFANLLDEAGHDVIITCDTYHKLGKLGEGMSLNKNVKLINLNAPTTSPICNIYKRIRGKIFPSWHRFNKLIKQENPDVIVCYFPVDLYNVTRFQNHNIPIVQMVHGYPPYVFSRVLKKKGIIKNFCLSSFKKVNTFQVLMPSYIKNISDDFKAKNIIRIANPVKQYNKDELVDLTKEKKKIIYIARIEKDIKRPHLLVEAFAKIAKDFKDWRVEIWGLRKYPEYDKEINDFIIKHQLQNQVELMGYANDVLSLYKEADIHAFPSRSEGFSLAIADGMSLGLPTIGFRDALSINEIIVDGHNGFLAQNLDDFAEKLKILMTNQDIRIEFGKNAHNDMKAYAPEVIINEWNKLFDSIKK